MGFVFPLFRLWPKRASLLILQISGATAKFPSTLHSHRYRHHDSADDHDGDDYRSEVQQVAVEEGIHLTLLRRKESDR